MNYLAHGWRFTADPYYLAGTAAPDWLSVIDRTVRLRSRTAAEFTTNADPIVAAVARGVVQHHADDARFHATSAFTELSLAFAVAIRDALPGDEGFRPSFLGHILVELLLDLLPLRQCFVARDRLPPKQLSDAIDRAMPMVRFFRLGDGTLAHFNGAGATATDSLATVLAYDDTEGAPLSAAPNSGYVRIERGTTLLIADMAAAPPASVSTAAHAGCFSFEMSSGEYPFIVNCGSPSADHDHWRMVARTTPAHSVLTFEDSSSANFAGPNGAAPSADAGLVGPANVQASLSEDDDGIELKGAHEGYASRYGVSYARRIVIAPDGLGLTGEERLSAPKGLKGEAVEGGGGFAVRFHLHPWVSATMAEDERSVLLQLPNRETWLLSADTPTVAVEESVFLADERGPRRTSQVVLAGGLEEEKEMVVHWRLERTEAREEPDRSDEKAGPRAA